MTAYQPLVYAPALTDSRAEHYHQNWFLCDTDFQLIPGSALSRLQEVSSSIYLGRLRLQAPGMLTLELLLDVIEDDDSVRCEAWVGEQRVPAITLRGKHRASMPQSRRRAAAEALDLLRKTTP